MQKSHPSDAPRRESAKSLILHMGDVEEIDASWVPSTASGSRLHRYRAIQILYELSKAYQERGTGVHFAHLREAHYRLFEIAGISDLVSLRISFYTPCLSNDAGVAILRGLNQAATSHHKIMANRYAKAR